MGLYYNARAPRATPNMPAAIAVALAPLLGAAVLLAAFAPPVGEVPVMVSTSVASVSCADQCCQPLPSGVLHNHVQRFGMVRLYKNIIEAGLIFVTVTTLTLSTFAIA